MHFRSDNNAPICPEVMAAILDEAERTDDAYGRDRASAMLNTAFSAFFECKTDVLPITTGTAANGLALKLMTQSTNSVLCDANSHLQTTEAYAAGHFQPGLKLELLESTTGKMDPEQMRRHLLRAESRDPRDGRPAIVSVTQPTESGRLYSLGELQDISDCAHRFDLKVHMDGARIGNALAALGCKPGDLTWRNGVDVLSFGGTKAGALIAEPIVLFANKMPTHAWASLKQSGNNLSKTRFVSRQLQALLTNDLIRRNGGQANERAAQLLDTLASCDVVSLASGGEVNIGFYWMPTPLATYLDAQGVSFAVHKHDDNMCLVRFVTSFATTNTEIMLLGNLLDAFMTGSTN